MRKRVYICVCICICICFKIMPNSHKVAIISIREFEEYENIYTLANYAILRDGKILYEIDNAFLMSRRNDTLFLLKGNYLYGVGTDGTPYIRSLHSLLNND